MCSGHDWSQYEHTQSLSSKSKNFGAVLSFWSRINSHDQFPTQRELSLKNCELVFQKKITKGVDMQLHDFTLKILMSCFNLTCFFFHGDI